MGSYSWQVYELKGTKLKARLKPLNEAFTPKKSSKFSIKQASKMKSVQSVHWDWPKLLDEEYPIVPEPWDLSHCFVDEKLLLNLRLLEKKPNASLLRYIYKQKLQALYHQKPKVTLTDKKRLKEQLEAELCESSLPTVKHCQGMFDFKKQSLMVFSTSQKIVQLFTTFFQNTFLSETQFLVLRTPGTIAVDTHEKNLESMLPWDLDIQHHKTRGKMT